MTNNCKISMTTHVIDTCGAQKASEWARMPVTNAVHDYITILLEHYLQVLSSSSNDTEIYRTQGKIHVLKMLLAFLNDLNQN